MSLRTSLDVGSSNVERLRALCKRQKEKVGTVGGPAHRNDDAFYFQKTQHDITTEEIAMLEHPMPVTSHKMLKQFFEESFREFIARYRFHDSKHEGKLLASAQYMDKHNSIVFRFRLYDQKNTTVGVIDVPLQVYVGTQDYDAPGYSFVPNLSWNEDVQTFLLRQLRSEYGITIEDTAPCPTSVISAVDEQVTVTDKAVKQEALSVLEHIVENEMKREINQVLAQNDDVEVVEVSDDMTLEREFIIGQPAQTEKIAHQINLMVEKAEEAMNEIDATAQKIAAAESVVSIMEELNVAPAPIVFTQECLKDVHATDIAFKSVVQSVVKMLVIDNETGQALDTQIVSDNVLLHLQEPGVIRSVFSTKFRPIFLHKTHDRRSLEFQLARCKALDGNAKVLHDIHQELHHLVDNERLYLQFDDSVRDDKTAVRELDVQHHMIMLPITMPQMLTLPTLRRTYDARLDRFIISNLTVQHQESSPVVHKKLRLLAEKIRDAWTKVCGKRIPIDNGQTVYTDD